MRASDYRIRNMEVADLDGVAQLEARSYEFPWTLGIFRDCLRVGYVCCTLESEQAVLSGYCIMAIAAGEAHILNLCVAPDLRRLGLGQRLLDHLLGLARQSKCRKIFLEVRPSNQPAIGLYQANDFRRIGIRRGYYRAREGKEDAIVLFRALA